MIHVRQRKMSERLHEWLDQYTEVSNKQQEYLGRIHDLRRNLLAKDDKHVLETIDKMRTGSKHKHKRKFPVYTLKKMEDTPINQGPDPFPSRPCLFHSDEKRASPRLNMVPHSHPRKLAPIVKRVKTDKYRKSPSPEQVVLDANMNNTPRPEISKMKTEYEPFESIAKRNRLNLTQFFNSGLSHQRSYKRMPISMSTVTIINEVSDDDEKRAFITDFTSKKVVNGVKDIKL